MYIKQQIQREIFLSRYNFGLTNNNITMQFVEILHKGKPKKVGTWVLEKSKEELAKDGIELVNPELAVKQGDHQAQVKKKLDAAGFKPEPAVESEDESFEIQHELINPLAEDATVFESDIQDEKAEEAKEAEVLETEQPEVKGEVKPEAEQPKKKAGRPAKAK